MNKFTGNVNVDIGIINRLNDKELGQVCQVNRYANSLCKNENLWMNRILKYYPEAHKYKKEDKTWRDYYIQIASYLGKYSDIDEAMKEAARDGPKEIVELFIEKGATHWNSGMANAVYVGHKDLVDFFIKKGANNWNWGMERAAKGGHKELVDFFISKGATNWDWGMVYAAQGGYKELVEFFIKKGATNWNWEWIMQH